MTPWQAGTQMRNQAMHLIRALVGTKQQVHAVHAEAEKLLVAVKQWDAIEQEQREGLSPEQRAVFDKDYSGTIRQRVNDKMRKNDSAAHIDDEGKVAALRVIALIDVLDEERER